ncbi:MAG TPA: hypothetical protein VH008_31860 [Pseudonocardia sp.]|jgi:hypothetical protein|nr:hypothetical protein [Pseudonocardia sp.]
MGMHNTSADGDPFTTVIGKNDSWYPCPDTASVDRHIVELSRRIGHARRKYPELAKSYRADIDLLLDRRNWLAVTERRNAERATERQATGQQDAEQQIPEQPAAEQRTAEQPVTEAA